MAYRTPQTAPRTHMLRGTYEVYHCKDPYPKEVELHHHDFYEVYFFLAGSVQYAIEGRSYLLSPGDVLLIAPQERHRPVFAPERTRYERVVLWINREFLESLSDPQEDLAACFDPRDPDRVSHLRLEESAWQQLFYQLERLLDESGERRPYARVSALTYLVQVLVQLNRGARLQAARDRQDRSQSGPAVYRAMYYINDHYGEDLTLDVLAGKFFLSKYHLSREFARLTGTSVHRYLTRRRLEAAQQMLREGLPSTEVYQRCGFGDYSSFYRAFRSAYQITPREYIARLKQAQPQAEELNWLKREER